MPDRRPPTCAEHDRVVAVGFLTEHDLSVLGQGFRRAYRLEEQHDFHDLLARIDRAEQIYQVSMTIPTGPAGR